jgi:RsiW-degrading membrane proteinase PrsW (M82 family)
MKSYPLFAAIPGILISGLVQEAAKLLPVGFYWWRHNRNISPSFGLFIGAAAGAGFGVSFQRLFQYRL